MSHLPIRIDEMMAVAGSTFVIAVSVLVVRYTSARFSSDKKEEEV
jgi:hypothetical protein